jgi:hypothetical protein
MVVVECRLEARGQPQSSNIDSKSDRDVVVACEGSETYPRRKAANADSQAAAQQTGSGA